MKTGRNIVLITIFSVAMFFLHMWLINMQYKRIQILIDRKFSEQEKQISALFEDTTFIINLTQ